jgi:hypothetical protein
MECRHILAGRGAKEGEHQGTILDAPERISGPAKGILAADVEHF